MTKTRPEDRLDIQRSWHDGDELSWTVRRWATRIGVHVSLIEINQMPTHWARISAGGEMHLNQDLLGLPQDLGEYVVVHELVHQISPKHGKLFNSFMDAFMPDWKEKQRRLNEYEP